MDLRAYVTELLDGARPLPIIAAGDPLLRQPSTTYDGQLGDLLPDLLAAMREAMHAAPGVGLAAPQVGVPLALAVVEDPADVDDDVRRVRERVPTAYRVLVNPSYRTVGERRVSFYEGCLSVPGWGAVTPRHHRVRLHGQDETGRAVDDELIGWAARIVQHETDHLRGVLYLDRAEIRSLASTAAIAGRWSAPDPAAAAAALGFGHIDRTPSDPIGE